MVHARWFLGHSRWLINIENIQHLLVEILCQYQKIGWKFASIPAYVSAALQSKWAVAPWRLRYRKLTKISPLESRVQTTSWKRLLTGAGVSNLMHLSLGVNAEYLGINSCRQHDQARRGPVGHHKAQESAINQKEKLQALMPCFSISRYSVIRDTPKPRAARVMLLPLSCRQM